MTAMDNSTVSSQQVVPSIEEIELTDFLESEIPVTVYLIILSVVGTIGNLHAIFIYSLRYKPSNHRTFVVWLASIDLVACIFSIPFELFDIRFNETFHPNANSVCKFFRLLNHFVSISSGTLLGVIAVERFRKACRPFGRQLTLRQAKWACFITVGLSIVFSIPAVIMYGVTAEPIDGYKNITGTDCTVLDSFKKNVSFRIYNYVLLLISTVVFVLCVIVYTMVGRVLYRQYLFRSSTQAPYKGRNNHHDGSSSTRPFQGINNQAYLTSPDVSSDMTVETTHKVINASPNGTSNKDHSKHGHGYLAKNKRMPVINDDESSCVQGTKHQIHKQGETKHFGINDKKAKPRLDRSKQITLMFLVATAVSYIGYLPYLFLTITKAVKKSTYTDISESIGPFNDIFLRGYFISNVSNPLVYCFLDNRFRHECKQVYRKWFSWNRSYRV